MNAFIIELENRPGVLADITEAIAQKGINITAIAAATATDMGSVALLTNDEAGTRGALQGTGANFREVALVSSAIEDRPGSLAQAARRLADAGVNIEALFATGSEGGKVTIAFAVNDAEAARTALGVRTGAASA
jgi:hypothetical protein